MILDSQQDDRQTALEQAAIGQLKGYWPIAYVIEDPMLAERVLDEILERESRVGDICPSGESFRNLWLKGERVRALLEEVVIMSADWRLRNTHQGFKHLALTIVGAEIERETRRDRKG